MHFSRPALHPPVTLSDAEKAVVGDRFQSIFSELRAPTAPAAPETLESMEIPLTTISLAGNFDSYISVGFLNPNGGAQEQVLVPLLFDTGNNVLVVPRWEDIEALPNWSAYYKVLCASKEPWGCPANVVQGPIIILRANGVPVTLSDCVFYACTADYKGGRTANFGAGYTGAAVSECGGGAQMLSPLQYLPAFPFAAINLAPAESIFALDGALEVASGSTLTLRTNLPAGFSMFDIVPNQSWMSLQPKALAIAGQTTAWPGAAKSPIAMIDTGGGNAFLSDPMGYVYGGFWPEPAPNPSWVDNSVNGCAHSEKCVSTRADISVTLGDASSAFTYDIDTSTLPAPVRNLTLTMCAKCCYMEGQQGMNIGGVSALALIILIDYANARVGLKRKRKN